MAELISIWLLVHIIMSENSNTGWNMVPGDHKNSLQSEVFDIGEFLSIHLIFVLLYSQEIGNIK